MSPCLLRPLGAARAARLHHEGRGRPSLRLRLLLCQGIPAAPPQRRADQGARVLFLRPDLTRGALCCPLGGGPRAALRPRGHGYFAHRRRRLSRLAAVRPLALALTDGGGGGMGGRGQPRGVPRHFPTRPPRHPVPWRADRERAPPGTTRQGAARGTRGREVGAAENSGIPFAPERSAPAVGAEHGQRAGVPPGPDLTRGPTGARSPARRRSLRTGGRGPHFPVTQQPGCGAPSYGPRTPRRAVPRKAVARGAGGRVRSRGAAARRAIGAGAQAPPGLVWQVIGESLPGLRLSLPGQVRFDLKSPALGPP